MSNRKKPEMPKPEALPQVETTYCNTYRYNVDGYGVLTIWGGTDGKLHTGLSFPMQLAIDLHQKFGNTIASLLRKQAAPDAEPPKPEEKPNE